MKIVIFAGGSGKRFWPASTKNNPKQFQEVIDNKPLIKLKYDYLRLGFNPEDIYISTGIQYKNEVESILTELPLENFIYEPAMRDTGPAVLYATEFLYKKFGNIPISLQWADHYIKKPEAFIEVLKEAEKILENNKNINLMVAVPIRFPSPHLGHIKNGNILSTIPNIQIAEFVQFVEKPTIEIAKQYMEDGHYSWNPGYFVTTPESIIEKYKKYAAETYEVINKIVESNYAQKELDTFANLEKKSFDYIFAENLAPSEANVLIADIGWSDVGEWTGLKEALQKSNLDNVISGNVVDSNSQDCLIYNYDDSKLVSTIGLNEMIVVNTKYAVAIFPKNKNAELKNYLKMLEEKGLTKYL